MSAAPSASLRAAWNAQAEWSARASRLKADIGRDRALLLGLTMATAVFGALGGMLTSVGGATGVAGQFAAAASALLAAIAGTHKLIAGKANKVEQWNRARSVSEALKEACYRYRTGTGAFAHADPDDTLREQLRLATHKTDDLLAIQPTRAVATREPPPPMDLAAYIERRITDQVERYYLRQVEMLSQRRDRWQRGQRALLYASALLGASVALWPGAASSLAGWVAVLTTAVGAFGAHIEGARFDHLIVAYRSTADRLDALRIQAEDDLARGKAVDFAALVDAAEGAISVENQAWMAGWSAQVRSERAAEADKPRT